MLSSSPTVRQIADSDRKPSLLSWLYRQAVQRPDLLRSLGYVALIIIFYELLWSLQLLYQPITQYTLGIVLLIAVGLAAFRHGLWPAMAVALIANIYLFYAYSGPNRNIEPFMDLARGEWLVALLYYGPALTIGYLHDRIIDLIARERLAREMAEQEQLRLVTILQQLPVGVVIADASSGKVIFGNQYLEQLLGHSSVGNNVTSDEQPSGRVLGNLTRSQSGNGEPTSVPLQEWPLKQVIEGQVLQSEEYVYAHSGHEHVLRVSGTPVYNSNNRITAGVVIIDDVTEEKALERRKDDFLSMVSHELKTPLTSLKMYVQLAGRIAGDKTIDGHLADSLHKANAQADKLTQLITDMLSLSRAQDGRLEYRFETVDINSLVNTIVGDLQSTNPDHQLIITGRCDVDMEADPDRLGQVVINLITNAIKYSPQADKIDILMSSSPRHIKIEVRDYGIGISPKEQKRIFERFYQVIDRSGKSYPGLGVGLYLSSEIVRQHHGKIAVSSELGKGSVFTVTLPVKQPRTK